MTKAAPKGTMTKEERAKARTEAKPLKTPKAEKADKKSSKPDKVAAKSDAKPEKLDSKGRPARPNRTESDSPTVREIVRLASRPEGATKAELEAASGWKNAGWPWMFFNPNTGKGIAPRYGFKLVKGERPAAEEGKRPLKTYCLVKQAA